MKSELYQQGVAKANEQDFAGAIAVFDELLRQSPDSAEAYYSRGLAYFNLGDLAKAIADYTSALELEANNANLQFARSLAHLMAGNLEEAIADAKQAILLKPTHAAAYHLLGTARQRRGDDQKAIAGYKKAAELYLDQKDAVNSRRCLEAIQALKLSQANLPVNAQQSPPAAFIDGEAFLQQSMNKAQQGNLQGALDDLDWALEIDPHDAQVYLIRGQVLEKATDWQAAIDDYRQAAKLFLDRADKTMAKTCLDAIDRLKIAQSRVVKVSDFRARRALSSDRIIPTDKLSSSVRSKLFRLVGNDRKIIAGLVERLKIKHPGMPENWYWEKAIYDLERDRF